jgi:hypothetical protein
MPSTESNESDAEEARRNDERPSGRLALRLTGACPSLSAGSVLRVEVPHGTVPHNETMRPKRNTAVNSNCGEIRVLPCCRPGPAPLISRSVAGVFTCSGKWTRPFCSKSPAIDMAAQEALGRRIALRRRHRSTNLSLTPHRERKPEAHRIYKLGAHR